MSAFLPSDEARFFRQERRELYRLFARLTTLPVCIKCSQDAYYNYDVETAPDRFMKQRRRWMNGIVGGINGAINPTAKLWWSGSSKPWHLKLRNFIVMIQQYVLVMQVTTRSP